MTDTELASFLCLSPDEAAKILPKLSPERRAAYERMAEVTLELNLWQAGLGPKPSGVIVCK